jgi:hypothetical protein
VIFLVALVSGLSSTHPTRAGAAVTSVERPEADRSSGSIPAPGRDGGVQQDFHWSGVVPAGAWVRIKGVHGSIRAEGTSGREVEVTAVRHAGRQGSPASVRIETVRGADGVTICAVYPTPSGSAVPNRCVPGEDWAVANQGNDVEVRFVVRIPRGVHFMGKTTNGAIDARALQADATVSTVNGDVTASAAGVVEASTVNGSIEVTTGTADPGRDLRFTTVNGNITLQLPAAFRARVDASLLNGEISSAFPLQVRRKRPVGQEASGYIGSGGRKLHLETVNGSIRIRRAGR